MSDYDFGLELMRNNYQLMKQNRQLMAENCELKQAQAELLADNLRLKREYLALLKKGQVVEAPNQSDKPVKFDQVLNSEDIAIMEQLIQDFPETEEYFSNLSHGCTSNTNNAH